MYKVAYKNSLKDMVPPKHINIKQPDLTECIFGYSDGYTTPKLKGRVQFGHACMIKGHSTNKVINTVLSSPKPTYYPFYVEQESSFENLGKYASYHSNKTKSGRDGKPIYIRGYKRYPHRNIKSSEDYLINKSNSSEKMDTQFIPMAKGAEFECEIRVHNLRPIELGALLSAITFHNNDGYRHGVGMAKPLGFGQCSIQVSSLEGFSNENLSFYLKAFECAMSSSEVISDWINSDQLKELFKMAQKPNQGQSNAHLKYPTLTTDGPNDFTDYKDDNKFLKRYSEILQDNDIQVQSAFENKEELDACRKQFHEQERSVRAVLKQIDEKAESLKPLAYKKIEANFDVSFKNIESALGQLQQRIKAEQESQLAKIVAKEAEEERQAEVKRQAEIQRRKEEEKAQKDQEHEQAQKDAVANGLNYGEDYSWNHIKPVTEKYLRDINLQSWPNDPPKSKYILEVHREELKVQLGKLVASRKNNNQLKPGKKTRQWKELRKWVPEETAKAWLKEFGVI